MARTGLRASTACVACLAACAAPEPVAVDLTDAGEGVGFLVIADELEGVRVEGPFGLSEGELTFGTAPRTALDEGAEGLVVFVPTAALEGALPAYAPSEGPRLQLRIDPPPGPALRPDGRLREPFPLPTGTQAWRVAAGESAPVALAETEIGPRLALEFDYDAEHCRPTTQDTLQRWPAPEGLGFANALTGRLRRVRHVDADRILATAWAGAFLIRRDEALTDDDAQGPLPRPVLRVRDLWAGEGPRNVVAGAIDPRPSPEGTRRALLVVLATDRTGTEARFESRALWATFDDRGWTSTRTATQTPSRLRDAAFAADGALRVVGDGGLVLRAAPGSDTLVETRIPDEARDENRRVTPTGDPARPWVMGGRNRAHTELDDGTYETVMFPSVIDDLHLEGLAADAREVWGGGTAGRIFVGDARGWGNAELRLPPRFGPCTQQTGVARPALSADVDDIALDDEHVVVASDDCALVLHIRRADRCTSAYLPQGYTADSSENVVDAVSIGFGAIVAVGADLSVFEVRLP